MFSTSDRMRDTLQAFQPSRRVAPAPRKVGPSEAERAAVRLLIASPSDSCTRHLVRDIAVFGPELLRLLHEDGVRIAILPCSVPVTHVFVDRRRVVPSGLSTGDGRRYCDVRGMYDSAERLVMIGEERLGRMTARHEVAHALDHYLGRLNGCRWISRPLQNLNQTRKAFVSAYAGTNSLEYFAESCEAWITGGLSRDYLRRCDPALHDWFATLFARFGVY